MEAAKYLFMVQDAPYRKDLPGDWTLETDQMLFF
jgi:hypothetical protein